MPNTLNLGNIKDWKIVISDDYAIPIKSVRKGADVTVFQLTKPWQRFIPKFLLSLFIKPTVFKNCVVESVEQRDNSNVFDVNIKYEIAFQTGKINLDYKKEN